MLRGLVVDIDHDLRFSMLVCGVLDASGLMAVFFLGELC